MKKTSYMDATDRAILAFLKKEPAYSVHVLWTFVWSVARVSQRTVYRHVDRLERLGLVADDYHGRCRGLKITAKGRRA